MSIIQDQNKCRAEVARLLVSRFLKSKGLAEGYEVDWEDLVSWYHRHILPTITSATHARYKSSIISASDHQDIRKLFTQRAPPKSELKILKTSRKRSKSLSPADMDKITGAAEKSSSKWAMIVERWLRATLSTGLRPHEWMFSKLVQDDMFLEVKNKKLEATVPDHGFSTRLVPLGHLTEEEICQVKQTLETAKDFSGGSYRFLYRQMRNWLYLSHTRIFPKRKKNISLMSARHQYQANLKVSGLTPKEIAYIVGHHADDRSFESYGGKRFGSPLSIDAGYIPQEKLDKIVEKIGAKWKGPNHGVVGPSKK